MRSPHGFLIVFVLLVRVLVARADDWPQWRGPNRDGHSKETGLLQVWPKDGQIDLAGEGSGQWLLHAVGG
jgi:hypothetical protein